MIRKRDGYRRGIGVAPIPKLRHRSSMGKCIYGVAHRAFDIVPAFFGACVF